MTDTTDFLGLITYHTVVDGTNLTDAYIMNVSGSATDKNLATIDRFASGTSASLNNIANIMSASIVVVGTSSSSLSNEKILSNGTGTIVNLNSGASTIQIDCTFGSATQISSGSSGTAIVSASGLSQSNYGTKTVCIPLNTSTALAGGETNYIRIPQYMNGWKLIDAAASCGAPNGSGSSTSGSPSFTLKRSSASSMTQVSLITNVITIDASEFDSSTSASPVVINGANTIYTGDKIWAATSASGTGVTYVEVSPTFRNMP